MTKTGTGDRCTQETTPTHEKSQGGLRMDKAPVPAFFFDLAVALARAEAARMKPRLRPERTLGDVFDDRASDRWERRRDERNDR